MKMESASSLPRDLHYTSGTETTATFSRARKYTKLAALIVEAIPNTSCATTREGWKGNQPGTPRLCFELSSMSSILECITDSKCRIHETRRMERIDDIADNHQLLLRNAQPLLKNVDQNTSYALSRNIQQIGVALCTRPFCRDATDLR